MSEHEDAQNIGKGQNSILFEAFSEAFFHFQFSLSPFRL
jgi:hypothetical protein